MHGIIKVLFVTTTFVCLGVGLGHVYSFTCQKDFNEAIAYSTHHSIHISA